MIVADQTLKAETLQYKLNMKAWMKLCDEGRMAMMPLIKAWAYWLTPKAKRWTNFCLVAQLNNIAIN